MKKTLNFIKVNYIEIIVILFSLTFSFWLMFSTFSYNNGSMLIATKAWSDFASHIPLIRSFSFGGNFPPEYPIFPGEPIRYHFLFYALVGVLEKLGLRIDYALNIPSAFSFAGLLIIIYYLAKKLFKSKFVGLLSVIFFLFNGSLSFLEFFKTHPLSISSISDIFNNSIFPSFGPYDGKIVSAFWNLNIYTNQRHLAFSFFLVLLIIYLLYTKTIFKKWITISLVGFIINILLFTNPAALLIAFLFISWLFFLKPKQNFWLLLTLPMLLLWLFIFPSFFISSHNVIFKPGFLIPNPLNFLSFINYWILNFGLSTILIPLSFFKINRKLKLLFLPMIILFIAPNLLQFSPDMINNHKFFNFFLILGSMLTVNLLVYLWKNNNLRGLFYKFLCIFLFIFLTLSGIIDLMPIKNDRFITINDYPVNQDIKWIMENTPKNSVFLNSSYLYNPTSLAGRKIFFGYSYFAWSYGYDTKKREKVFLEMLEGQTKNRVCLLLKKSNISFVELNNFPSKPIDPNWNLWRNNFKVIYSNPRTGETIYNVFFSCR